MITMQDKIVWVTGASSGLGVEIVRQCASKGAKIILSARNENKLNDLRSELNSPDDHLVLPLDLSDSSNFDDLVKRVLKKYGRIDALFNNGGISQRSEAGKTSLEIDREIMEVNYFGNIALTKAVLPVFQEQKSGHYIIVSSIAGKFGFFLRSAYSASKHALHGFYESLMLEEEHNNIHVTIACPGKINTAISVNALNSEGKSTGVMDDNQANGMSAEECVRQLLKAVQKNKKEILIGNKEIKAVTLKHLFPRLFWKVIKKQK